MASRHLANVIQPSHSNRNQPCAYISWDGWKEIRIYHLGPGNVLQEYAYSASKDRNSWHYGQLHDLKIVLDPTSTVAAVRSQAGMIWVQYQDPNDDTIRALFQLSPTDPWQRSSSWPTPKALKGSSIAAVEWRATGRDHFSIFYQDPTLHLREYSYDHSEYRWVVGDFNPGVQTRGTPISAAVTLGYFVSVNVIWRDAHGWVMSSSWSKSFGWDVPTGPIDGIEVLDGKD